MILIPYNIYFVKPLEIYIDSEVHSKSVRRMYHFAIRDEPGALAQAMQVFLVSQNNYYSALVITH